MPVVVPGLAGRTYPPKSYLVGREKIREFARAVRSTNPLHLDVEAARAAGFDDVIAPTTFTSVMAGQAVLQLVEDPEVGLEPSRVVHGTERIEHVRPIVAGDALETTMTVTDVTERAGTAIMSTVFDIHDTSGNTVATVTSTLLVRGDDE